LPEPWKKVAESFDKWKRNKKQNGRDGRAVGKTGLFTAFRAVTFIADNKYDLQVKAVWTFSWSISTRILKPWSEKSTLTITIAALRDLYLQWGQLVPLHITRQKMLKNVEQSHRHQIQHG
jgi:hypothetical protein